MTQAINTRNPDGPTWPHDQLIHAWWVMPGRLLAGEYPGSLDPLATHAGTATKDQKYQQPVPASEVQQEVLRKCAELKEGRR